MGVLLDTDVLIDLEREGSLDRLDELAPEENRSISVITVSELLQGVLRADGPQRSKRSAFVEHLLAALEPVPVSQQIARTHANLWAQLAGAGRPIGSHDLWIASTAVALGLILATRNRDEFRGVPGLELLAD